MCCIDGRFTARVLCYYVTVHYYVTVKYYVIVIYGAKLKAAPTKFGVSGTWKPHSHWMVPNQMVLDDRIHKRGPK